MEVKQATFTSLVFTATGRMAQEGINYHNRFAKPLSIKKNKDYVTTVS